MTYIGRGGFMFRICVWQDDNLLLEPAGIDDHAIAVEAWKLYCRQYPNRLVTLQQGARVVRKSGE